VSVLLSCGAERLPTVLEDAWHRVLIFALAYPSLAMPASTLPGSVAWAPHGACAPTRCVEPAADLARQRVCIFPASWAAGANA